MHLKSTLSYRKTEPERSVLYIVGTPIGNLDDISTRAIKVLRNVSLVACEDTRHTKKIMGKFQISNSLISCNKHNYFQKIPFLVNNLKEGKSIALVSDAGMPSICDPGEEIVRAVKSYGFDVICIPGPCAAIHTSFEWNTIIKFYFFGFSTKKKKERKLLSEISQEEKTVRFCASSTNLAS